MAKSTGSDLLAKRKAAVAANRTGSVTRPSVPPARPVATKPEPTAVRPLGKKAAAPPPVEDDEDVIDADVVEDDDLDDEDVDDGDDGDDEEDAPAPAPVARKTAKAAAKPVVASVTKAVVPVGKSSRSLALPMASAIPRNKQITTRDRIIPRLAISQAMSKVAQEGAVPIGNWYHTTTRSNLGQDILFVPVDWNKSRSLYVRGKGVMCRSFDLIKGEGEPGILCEGTEEEMATEPEDERGCPNRLWTEGPDGRRIPPPCGEAHNFFGLILDNEDPINGPVKKVLLTFRSTAVRAAKAIISIVSDADDDEGDGSIVWHKNILHLSVQNTERNGNSYFSPAVEFWGENEGRSLSRAENFAGQLTGMNLRTSLEARNEE